jgi:hypothetical protein
MVRCGLGFLGSLGSKEGQFLLKINDFLGSAGNFAVHARRAASETQA